MDEHNDVVEPVTMTPLETFMSYLFCIVIPCFAGGLVAFVIGYVLWQTVSVSNSMYPLF